jgi:hypothetical protein
MGELEKSIPDIVLSSVEQLVTEYLLRRKETVIQATIELFSGMVIGLCLEALVGISDIKKYHEFYEKCHKNHELKHIGTWENDWSYRIHGIGCELIHQQTKEIFDWDLGDPNYFTLAEFQWHLEWRVQNNPSEFLSNYLAWAKDIERTKLEQVFEALQAKGILRKIVEFDPARDWGHGEWEPVNPLFDVTTYTMPRY